MEPGYCRGTILVLWIRLIRIRRQDFPESRSNASFIAVGGSSIDNFNKTLTYLSSPSQNRLSVLSA